MVRFQPDLYTSNSARPNSSPSSLRNGRPSRISQHNRTASANTRDLLHRVLNGGQTQQLHALRSASSSSLSGLEYAAGAASSSPQRNNQRGAYFSNNRRQVEPLSLQKFAKREVSVVLLWKVTSFVAYSVLRWPRQRNHILATSLPYFLTLVQRKTSVLPFWPARLAEYGMGRLSKQEIVASLSIHAFVFALSLLLAATAFPGQLVEATSLHQERQEHELWNDPSSLAWIFLRFLPTYIRETLSTAIFVLSLLVLPTILDLNRFPPWSMVLLYYPWGSSVLQRWLPVPVGVDFVLSLDWASEATGAILAGELMDLFFPDDSQRKSPLLERA